MFTGIITDLGEVLEREGSRLRLATAYDMAQVPLGASIACDGVCLTVVEKAADSFLVEVSPETFACTTLGDWQPGRKVNLERPVQAGGEFGGHFVTGHVDAVGQVEFFVQQGEFWLLQIGIPYSLQSYFAEKGSVTINGVSLTVNTVETDAISMTIIPHTAAATNLGGLKSGDAVNLEVDLIARYIAPYLQKMSA